MGLGQFPPSPSVTAYVVDFYKVKGCVTDKSRTSFVIEGTKFEMTKVQESYKCRPQVEMSTVRCRAFYYENISLRGGDMDSNLLLGPCLG